MKVYKIKMDLKAMLLKNYSPRHDYKFLSQWLHFKFWLNSNNISLIILLHNSHYSNSKSSSNYEHAYKYFAFMYSSKNVCLMLPSLH